MAIAHDYLTQRGGAERVVLNLVDAFPGSRVITALYAPDRTFEEFRQVEVQTLWTNRFSLLRNHHRLAFPLLADAWGRCVANDVDAVICSSSGWSHGIVTTGAKIVYCYNPARWLYQPHDYMADTPVAVRPLVALARRTLKKWDLEKAQSADCYVTTSRVVARRIDEAYGIQADLIPPPISIDPTAPQIPVQGLEPGFLLAVSRARGYKNTQLLCEAISELPGVRLALTGSLPSPPPGRRWGPNVVALGTVSEAELRWLYAHCRAVLSASHEDFGLTPLEGNAFGKPAVLLRAGGFLDTLVEGVTGVFIEEPTVSAVQAAISQLPSVDEQIVKTHARRYDESAFRRAIQERVRSAIGAHRQHD